MNEPRERSSHPLAWELARANIDAPALLVGIGSARNLPPFLESDRLIIALDENETRVAFLQGQAYHRVTTGQIMNGVLPVSDASVGVILATHVLQHGTWATLRATIAELARVAQAGTVLGLVFASTADARYGKGRLVETQCFAALEGDEINVTHIYLTEAQIRAELTSDFVVDRIEHVDANAIAGSWAHRNPEGLRHFFVVARRQ